MLRRRAALRIRSIFGRVRPFNQHLGNMCTE